jgi:hypothetical protein
MRSCRRCYPLGVDLAALSDLAQRSCFDWHSPSSALSARGISIAIAKTSVNAGRHRRTYRQESGHKGGVGGALKEARHRRREDAPGVAELAYQQSFQV